MMDVWVPVSESIPAQSSWPVQPRAVASEVSDLLALVAAPMGARSQKAGAKAGKSRGGEPQLAELLEAVGPGAEGVGSRVDGGLGDGALEGGGFPKEYVGGAREGSEVVEDVVVHTEEASKEVSVFHFSQLTY